MKKFRLFLLSLVLLFAWLGCSTSEDKYGMVELYHGRPKVPRMLPRTIFGPLPTGPFDSHKIEGIMVMDIGADYDADTSLTYLSYLYERYTNANSQGDVPFHFFIDQEGITYRGRQDIIPAEIHEGDPFTFRSKDLTRQEMLMARLARRNQPLINIKGYIVICLLGDYDKQIVTEAQEKSLFQLIAYLTHENRISFDNIKGLNEVNPNIQNPGFYLRNYLQKSVLTKNVPPPAVQHRFMVSPEEVNK